MNERDTDILIRILDAQYQMITNIANEISRLADLCERVANVMDDKGDPSVVVRVRGGFEDAVTGTGEPETDSGMVG